MGRGLGSERGAPVAANTVTAVLIAYDAPTGTLSITKGHMHVHGSVEEVSAFASTLIRAVRDQKVAEEPSGPPHYLHTLEDQWI